MRVCWDSGPPLRTRSVLAVGHALAWALPSVVRIGWVSRNAPVEAHGEVHGGGAKVLKRAKHGFDLALLVVAYRRAPISCRPSSRLPRLLFPGPPCLPPPPGCFGVGFAKMPRGARSDRMLHIAGRAPLAKGSPLDVAVLLNIYKSLHLRGYASRRVNYISVAVNYISAPVNYLSTRSIVRTRKLYFGPERRALGILSADSGH